MAKEGRKGNKGVSTSAALVGGLMIAALSFTAGVVGAGSHKVDGRSTTAATSIAQSRVGTVEERVPTDQGVMQQRVPGHSECDLQLN
jgi:hypothetical protein